MPPKDKAPIVTKKVVKKAKDSDDENESSYKDSDVPSISSDNDGSEEMSEDSDRPQNNKNKKAPAKKQEEVKDGVKKISKPNDISKPKDQSKPESKPKTDSSKHEVKKRRVLPFPKFSFSGKNVLVEGELIQLIDADTVYICFPVDGIMYSHSVRLIGFDAIESKFKVQDLTAISEADHQLLITKREAAKKLLTDMIMT